METPPNYVKGANRPCRPPHLAKRTMPSVVDYLQTRTSTLSPSKFLEAEARGSRARQKHASLDEADHEHVRMARLKARITLAKVKGYWE